MEHCTAVRTLDIYQATCILMDIKDSNYFKKYETKWDTEYHYIHFKYIPQDIHTHYTKKIPINQIKFDAYRERDEIVV